MLGTRVVIGLSMAGIVIAVLALDEWLAPWFPFWLIVTTLASGAAALEMIELLKRTNAKPSGRVVVGGVLALVLSNWAPHVLAVLHRLPQHVGRSAYDPLSPVNALAWPLLTFAAIVMVAFLVESVQFDKPGSAMATIAGTIFAVSYIGLLGSFVIQMRWLDGVHHGLIPVVYMIATAKGADVGAYTLGRIAGRHKLWPQLSPNKTVEGAVGGLIFSVGFAFIVSAVARYALGANSLSPFLTVVFGVVVGAAAQLGDLMESMIKRDCSRKDASAAVPGFGGVLDVIDSLLFAGPVAFGFWLVCGV